MVMPSGACRCALHAQIPFPQAPIGIQRGGITAPYRLAAFQYDVTIGQRQQALDRSEEHTSELQSLMRISYAVFCLKKKKQKNTTNIKTTHREERHTNTQTDTTN